MLLLREFPCSLAPKQSPRHHAAPTPSNQPNPEQNAASLASRFIPLKDSGYEERIVHSSLLTCRSPLATCSLKHGRYDGMKIIPTDEAGTGPVFNQIPCKTGRGLGHDVLAWPGGCAYGAVSRGGDRKDMVGPGLEATPVHLD